MLTQDNHLQFSEIELVLFEFISPTWLKSFESNSIKFYQIYLECNASLTLIVKYTACTSQHQITLYDRLTQIKHWRNTNPAASSTIVTARVRSTTGDYVCTGVCLFNFNGGGWGYPHPSWLGVSPSFSMGIRLSFLLTGGTPSSPDGGTLSGMDGGTPNQDCMEVPVPCPDWIGYPILDWMGVYLSVQTGWGTPSGLNRVPPKHREA